jgi:hypothetical protein
MAKLIFLRKRYRNLGELKGQDICGRKLNARDLGSGLFKKNREDRCWWLTPIILASWEAGIRRISVGGWPWQKVHETTSRPIAAHSGTGLSSQLQREA